MWVFELTFMAWTIFVLAFLILGWLDRGIHRLIRDLNGFGKKFFYVMAWPAFLTQFCLAFIYILFTFDKSYQELDAKYTFTYEWIKQYKGM